MNVKIWWITCEQSVLSGPDGRFSLGKPPYTREFTVVAKKGRRAATRTINGEPPANLELVLKPGVKVSGAAYLPNGAPAAGLEIAGVNTDRGETVSVVTNADGTYSMEISPGIYRFMLTMMMSIVHRITGGALYVGTLLLVWWLGAAAAGPNAYADVQWFMETLLGRLILFGYTWALIHHMLGGIRHLIWDTTYGMGPVEREWLTVATLVGSIGLTIILWFVGYLMMGGGYLMMGGMR